MSRASSLLPRLIIALLSLAVLIAAAALVALIVIRRLPQQELAPDLFVLEDRGGNTTVLVTSEGAMVVDTKFWRFGERLRKAVETLTDKPIKYVINTHYHWDHAQGNVAFPTDATFVSTPETLSHLLKLDPEFWAKESAKPFLPSRTFEEKDHHIKIGGQLVHVVRVGRGHTDGDCVVYFPAQGVVEAGDLFFNGYYPVVDHQAGGSILEWIETVDRILALGPTRIVPGHGPVTEPAELKAFQGFLRDLVFAVYDLKAAGKTREQVMQELKLPVHEARMKNLYNFSSLAQNAADVYDELAQGGKLPERQPGAVGGEEAIEGEPEEQGEGPREGEEGAVSGQKEGGATAAPSTPAEEPAPPAD